MEPIDEVKCIFENINHWLNFIELKHAAILTFDIAILNFIGLNSKQILFSRAFLKSKK